MVLAAHLDADAEGALDPRLLEQRQNDPFRSQLGGQSGHLFAEEGLFVLAHLRLVQLDHRTVGVPPGPLAVTVMFDGQGIAHPRRVGIASHVGLLIKRPTLGCAKSVLVGKFEELVVPATYAFPLGSTVTPYPMSALLPPRKEEYTRAEPLGFSLVRKASVFPPP